MSDAALDVAAGTSHSLALLADGSVVAWGDGNYGQLADGSEKIYSTAPITVEDPAGGNMEIIPPFPRDEGTGDKSVTPRKVENLNIAKVYGVYAGGDVSGAIVGDGTEKEVRSAYLWGSNEHNQIGRTDTVEETIAYSGIPTALKSGLSGNTNEAHTFEDPSWRGHQK